MEDNKSVLITGAAGFLGSHLCDYFLNVNYKVTGVDNLVTGNINNLNHLSNNKNFEFINQDICDKINLDTPLKYILHFASPASPIDYLKIPIKTLKVSSIGTHNVFDLAKKKNAKVLIASTSEVYGDPTVHPQDEEYWGNVNPIGPRSVYDEAKRYMEAYSVAFSKKYDVKLSIVRIFNTYGPRMRLNDGRAIPNFIGQVLRNENLTVFGDGSQTRSFCYVDDLIEGIYQLLINDYSNPVNIGNPDEISLKNFAQEIIGITNSKSKITFEDLPLDDPKQRKPNISKAKQILGWSPKTSRKEGLIKTFNYFKNLPKESWYKKHKSFNK